MFGVGDAPVRATAAEEALVGRVVDSNARAEAARLVSESVDLARISTLQPSTGRT